MKLTVYYNDQFWVGVLEQVEEGRLKAARHIFGLSEPSDVEVLAFVLEQVPGLLDQVQGSLDAGPADLPRRISPKRAARQAARELSQAGASSQAQEAMRLDLEQRKLQRKTISREQREAEAARQWELRRARAKARHRGH